MKFQDSGTSLSSFSSSKCQPSHGSPYRSPIIGGVIEIAGDCVTSNPRMAHTVNEVLMGNITDKVLQIPVLRYCSYDSSLDKKTNVRSALSLNLRIIRHSDLTVVCSRNDTAQIKEELSAGQITVSNCDPGDGMYMISLQADNGAELMSNITFTSSASVWKTGIFSTLDSQPGPAPFDNLTFQGGTCDFASEAR